MAAQNYYGESQQGGVQSLYGQQQQQQQGGYGGGGYQENPQAQYSQAPPTYNQQSPGHSPLMGEKQSFEQTFKLEKPKYNDLWAGILVSRIELLMEYIEGEGFSL